MESLKETVIAIGTLWRNSVMAFHVIDNLLNAPTPFHKRITPRDSADLFPCHAFAILNFVSPQSDVNSAWQIRGDILLERLYLEETSAPAHTPAWQGFLDVDQP